MQPSLRAAVVSSFLLLSALTVQATDQPATPAGSVTATGAAQSTLKPAPGLSLLPAVKEAAQPVTAAKIGVVDINIISMDSAIGKDAQTKIKGLQAKLQKQVEAKRKQLDKFKADTERQLPSLSPQQREAKSKEFQKKVEEFQKFGMKLEKELMDSQQKLTKALFEAIGKAAEELGKNKGLTAITVNRELLFLGAGVEPVDLTADLVKLLDENGSRK